MPQQKKQQNYVPVTFMVPASLLGSMQASEVTCQVGQARFKAVKVTNNSSPKTAQQPKKQQQQQQPRQQQQPQKQKPKEPLRPHLYGGRTASQLLQTEAIYAKRHRRPIYDTTTDDGKLTPSQLALNQIPKQFQTNYATVEKGRLTPSQLYVANRQQERRSLRRTLNAGPTASQLFVKTERRRLQNRNQRALESLQYLTGVAELLAPTVYPRSVTTRSKAASTGSKKVQQQQQRQQVPSLPARLEPTPSLLLLKYLSQVPPALPSSKKAQQQKQAPAKKWEKKANKASNDNLFLEPLLAAFQL